MRICKVRHYRWLMAMLLSGVFMTVMLADVRYTSSDPKSSLLVSEALVTNGTIRLDQFGSDVLDLDHWTIHKK